MFDATEGYLMRTFKALPVVLLTAACAAQQPTNAAPQVTNYESESNLKATKPVACIGLDELTNQNTPADIFPGVRKCIDAGEYEKAANLFAVAGVYGRFDTLRIVDKTAHQAIKALQLEYLSSIDKARAEEFQEAIRGRLDADSSDLVRICDDIKKIGAPEYEPVYMLQHGISAFTGTGGGIKTDFNVAEAWAASLEDYLHCPR